MIDPESLGLEVGGRIGADEVKVKCPYHDDTRPSAEFNVRTGLFYCFACGTGKTAAQVASDLGGSISDIPEIRHAVVYSDPTISWRTRFMARKLAIDNPYLVSRGVANRMVYDLKIMEMPDGIVFPLFSTIRRDVAGVQVRYFERQPKYVFYGEKPKIYPLPWLPLRRKRPAVIVEGIFSVIRGMTSGFATFATLGSQSIGSVPKIFYDRTDVVAAMDPDQAGYIAMAKLAAIGIPCVGVPFEADEESPDRWNEIIGDRANFTSEVAYFAKMAVNKGADPRSLLRQITKFQKENT